MTDKTKDSPGYEKEDVSASPVVWAGVILASVIVLSVAAMTLMFGVLYQYREADINTIGPMADLQEKPRGPILQVDPPRELTKLRQEDAAKADSYGWVSRENGTVRIPVSRAMELVVARGIR
jgi:hypothetical protein